MDELHHSTLHDVFQHSRLAAPEDPIFVSTIMFAVSIKLFWIKGFIASKEVTAMHPGQESVFVTCLMSSQ